MISGCIRIRTDKLIESAPSGMRKVKLSKNKVAKSVWRQSYSKKNTYLREILVSLAGVKELTFEEQGEFTFISYIV